jgi:hypothetical protein
MIEVSDEAALELVRILHPGRQALWHKDSGVRQSRLDDRLRAYGRAADLL